MKHLFTFFALLFSCNLIFANGVPDSTLIKLDAAIDNHQFYEDQKIKQLKVLKERAQRSEKLSLEQQYKLYSALYDEYRSYSYDSSFVYINKLRAIADKLNDPVKQEAVKIKLGFILLSSGMFKEGFDTLRVVKTKLLPTPLKQEFFSLMGASYYNLGDYNKDNFYTAKYNQLGSRYIDSALAISDPNSYEYLSSQALKFLKENKTDSSLKQFQTVLENFKLSKHQYAIVTSTLSDIYIRKGETDQAIQLLAEAAIADIQSSTKETTAILILANLLYQKGDVKRAYDYIKYASEDAAFYGARQRKIQVSAIMPIIAGEKLNSIEAQKRALILYSSIITLLSLLVIGFVVIIFKQVKKLKEAEKTIKASNTSLQAMNHLLMEAEKIKEEYIGYSFHINSKYIDKIERFKKNIDQNLTARKFDEIKLHVNRIDPKKEREELYHGFDKVFLRLFPHFITDFNSLFKDDDQIKLSGIELLNTELRIFALIRLGITDNEKIAQILDFSVNTIYSYKTRIKNRSLVPNEAFEDRIMAIKAI
ncbi:DUF6377 domain-containing protein [Solitalea canadensis]|uniref:DUF6377 domain-containing protein n=1 Tax=Solitalea canadensis (strain ATCC 29591 / DSM 3403 / JCM 21819 / LMG 8368 / NBRC 15130 / NCIMB 12057 / USAM 9D) TaxID=929556 RepID=H8KNG1_SOLCM|nr:DUF6377 domain-containing protein [Solitalea canadensis]AFD07959.1 hypothetical protein Solca_2940 [Solitalea canadensis DSM 3403]